MHSPVRSVARSILQTALGGLLLALPFHYYAAAQTDRPDGGDRVPPSPAWQWADSGWDTTKPRGTVRDIEFTTREGTWMSMDVSPDGRWLTFDLLGHVYLMSSDGGRAVALTQDSGIALNFHPRFSPDGQRIAFVSDRTGQNALWTMHVDGSNVRQVFFDRDSRIAEPQWTPDGRHIIAVRESATPGRGWHRRTTDLWLFPADGGDGKRIIGGTMAQYNGPAVSPDGSRLFFHVSYFTNNRYGTQAGHRIQSIDLGRAVRGEDVEPVEVVGIRKEHNGYQAFQVTDPSLQPPDVTAHIAPQVSPDGRYLAYAREIDGETFSWRGHSLEPRTALWLLDLSTGNTRQLASPATKDLSAAHAMYSYRTFPGYAWSPDSRYIYVTREGGIARISVASGEISEIPFEAEVRRTISEQVRGRQSITDRFDVRAPRWPATSPDGTRLAFIALGQLWIKDTRSGRLTQVGEPSSTELYLTPDWTPDGRSLLYATWNDRERGHLWIHTPGQQARRLTELPGEYLYPQMTTDGRFVIALRGPQQPSRGWNPWAASEGWEIVRMASSDGELQTLAVTHVPRHPRLGADGRIHFEYQPDPAATAALYNPYPPPSATEQRVTLQSINPDGTALRAHAILPARVPQRGANAAAISPDGRRVAFTSAREIFIADLTAVSAVDGLPYIDPDPNLPSPGVTRISVQGGLDHRWKDSDTLEYVSGNMHVSHDLRSGEVTRVPLGLNATRPAPAGTIAFTNARIITMRGDEVLENADLVVRGSRIACVGECAVAGADRVVDLAGKTLMPGIVDVHVHETNFPLGILPQHIPSMATKLAYGVTTILDPSTNSESAFPLAERIDAGLLLGPRVYSVGEIIVSPGVGFGDQLDIEDFADARTAVARRAEWGAISIKNFRQARRDQTQKVIEAARNHDVTVTGEGGPLYFTLSFAMDGQTGWEHNLGPLPIYSDVARFLGQAGMVYSPTASVAGHGKGAIDFFRSRHDLRDDEKYRRFMPMALIRQNMERTQSVPDTYYSFPMLAEGLKDIIAEGGYGAIGEHSEQNGIGSHWEIWAYASALDPHDALRVATLHGAHFIGLDQEIGSIEAGKLADLLILERNPLDDIRNTLAISQVMKGGWLHDGATLDQVWPEPTPYGPAPWVARLDDENEMEADAIWLARQRLGRLLLRGYGFGLSHCCAIHVCDE